MPRSRATAGAFTSFTGDVQEAPQQPHQRPRRERPRGRRGQLPGDLDLHLAERARGELRGEVAQPLRERQVRAEPLQDLPAAARGR